MIGGKLSMKRLYSLLIILILSLIMVTGCSQSKKMTEVKPVGQTMLNNYKLGETGSNAYSGYIGVKIRIGDSDLKVTMLGRIGKHMRNDHTLSILDETKAVIATAKITNTPDAYYKNIAYSKINSAKDTILKAKSVYYIVSKEEKEKDFWYGEKTSTNASPYFAIEGVVMSVDAYDFAFMKNTSNKVLGPVDFAYSVVEKGGK